MNNSQIVKYYLLVFTLCEFIYPRMFRIMKFFVDFIVFFGKIHIILSL